MQDTLLRTVMEILCVETSELQNRREIAAALLGCRACRALEHVRGRDGPVPSLTLRNNNVNRSGPLGVRLGSTQTDILYTVAGLVMDTHLAQPCAGSKRPLSTCLY